MIAITRPSSELATARFDAASARREATVVGGDRPVRLAAFADEPVARWASECRIGLDVAPALVRRPVEEEAEEYERWDGLA